MFPLPERNLPTIAAEAAVTTTGGDIHSLTGEGRGSMRRVAKPLEGAGTPIWPDDLIVAATVRTNGGTLVTHNSSEFRRVADLKIVDWTAG